MLISISNKQCTKLDPSRCLQKPATGVSVWRKENSIATCPTCPSAMNTMHGCASQAHAEDVTGDACAICGGSEDIATDWISCDQCETWVHFSCDTRPYLGAFKDYSKGQGQTYTCARCHDARKRKTPSGGKAASAATTSAAAAADAPAEAAAS